MRCHGWTADELAVLRAGIAEGRSHHEIADKLGRTRQGVSYMAARLGFGKPRKDHAPDEVRARLLANREITPSGCWEWTGHRRARGYGWIGLGYQPKAVHRVAYELFVGPIPDGLCVMHLCDNPPCFNPDHLTVGTLTENNADKQAKGRQARGVGHGMAKLSEATVREIKARLARGERQVAVARALGVNHATVQKIASGKQWREVRA